MKKNIEFSCVYLQHVLQFSTDTVILAENTLANVNYLIHILFFFFIIIISSSKF